MTLWTPTDDGHADLSSHDSFVQGAPHATFARLRRDNPMAWCDYAGGQGFCARTSTMMPAAAGLVRSSSRSP